MRPAPADDPDTVRGAKTAILIEGQPARKTIEEFDRLTMVEYLEGPK